jgi:hypothetical protein
VLRSAAGGATGGALADALAGLAEDVLDDAAEGKTTTTIRAAMPAMSRPYSTADAPRSSILARRALSMMRR